MGFTEPPGSPRALVRSYRTVSPLPVPLRAIGGLFSVALSCGSPRLGVGQHRALWSPDVPRTGQARTRSPSHLTITRRHCRTSATGSESLAIAAVRVYSHARPGRDVMGVRVGRF